VFIPHDERGMYCSRECGGLARRDPDAIITRSCRQCGAPFQVYRSYVEWGSGKYCSQECHLLDRSPTGPEERLYDLLDIVLGPGEWIPQYEALPGRKWSADAAVPGRLLTLQADGDFWHGKDPAARANPKVASNLRRDAAFDDAAESQGWRVLRLWESELRDGPGVQQPPGQPCARRGSARARSRTAGV
jgi:G:T-mismatch repair DNA endonuclease (very short patch repair protein)